MKITAQTEAVSSPPEEKWHWSQQWRQNTFRAGQKLKADWKKDLQNLGAGRKSRKPPTPFVGMKPNGKSQLIAESRPTFDWGCQTGPQVYIVQCPERSIVYTVARRRNALDLECLVRMASDAGSSFYEMENRMIYESNQGSIG